MLREGFEGEHGVGFLDSFNCAHAIGDQCGNIIVGFGAHNCNQIINPGDRVYFRNFRLIDPGLVDQFNCIICQHRCKRVVGEGFFARRVTLDGAFEYAL